LAIIVDDISRTFNEYLLLPGLTKKEHVPLQVSLKVPVQKFKEKSGPGVCLNAPLVSASMQAVAGPELATALARKGGCAFIYCSQSIESQAEMVRKVKEHKAGFVASDSNLAPTATLQDAIDLRARTNHSTIAITKDGTGHSKLLGILSVGLSSVIAKYLPIMTKSAPRAKAIISCVSLFKPPSEHSGTYTPVSSKY